MTKINNKAICLLYLLLVTFTKVSFCERITSYSASISSMKELLATELLLIEKMSAIAVALEQKLKYINNGLEKFKIEHKKSQKNPEKYLANPLNGFALIRRMHMDWHTWIHFLKTPISRELIDQFERQYYHDVPTLNDFAAAVNGIFRIQSVYDLNPTDMAQGFLNGKQYSAKLSALDSFLISHHLFRKKCFENAINWIKTALRTKFDDDLYAEVFQIRISDFYDAYKQYSIIEGVDFEAVQNESNINMNNGTSWEYKDLINIKDWCRLAENKPSTNKFHCRYYIKTNDFLKLGPLKIEEFSLDPYIVLFHEVFSDQKTIELKRLARLNLMPAQLYEQNENFYEFQEYRFAKGYWMKKSNFIDKLAVDLTGFDKTRFEDPQILNYGIGGQYALHVDYFPPNTSNNRIATIIFYLSDVEQGGATVFPKINLKVTPKKGSALLWYNLKSNGEGDPRTMHIGCPVIVGSKWITTLWIAANEQF